MRKTVAIYPGTFDPVTNGHIDIIKRALELFDKLIVAVAHNPQKDPMFTAEERGDFIRKATTGWKNLEIDSFEDLLINFARKRGASVIIKGLRAISDFDFELQMGLMNRTLDKSLETIFMIPSEEYSFLSSKIIKEIASFHGDVSSHVPPSVAESLKNKFQ
ncbi:MAG: pantetheine-phosphate adenylyltransferase [Nitrospinota bacterium]|jgi:pantetheine-phosphate adenylyltransferase|nr:pantetheine-phosphate adenylyltransferase [Nitrospinota bacterium]